MYFKAKTQHDRILQVLFFLVLSLIPLSARSSLRIIDSVETVPQGKESEIRIRFRIPVNLLSHAPQRSGNLLQIQLQPFPTTDITSEELQERERRSWNPTEELPLTEILFEGDGPEGPLLILRFQKMVTYQLRESKDHRGIVVTLSAEKSTPTLPPETGQDIPMRTASTTSQSLLAELDKNPDKVYSINLLSSAKPIDPSTQTRKDLFGKHTLYTTEYKKNGITWHRLRLGFFFSKETAEKVMPLILKTYPTAWITKVHADAARKILQTSGSIVATRLIRRPPIQKIGTTSSSLSQGGVPQMKKDEAPSPEPSSFSQETSLLEAVQESKDPSEAHAPLSLLEEANQAMTGKEYRRAIQLYTKILSDPNHKDRQAAQELLALARERNGQLAHAKAEYEKYLQLYPKGEEAQRVRQRLYGLLTARATPRDKLRKSKKTAGGEAWRKDVRGSLSQFYWRDKSRSNISGEILDRSLLTTDLDITTRLRNDRYEVEGLFIGGYDNDFNDDSEDETRVNDLYIDALDKKSKVSGRLGRQSRSTGGVLGRFDGGLFNYQALPQVAFSLVGGYPVDFFTRNNINWDKNFYGLSMDLGTFADRWDFNTFYITQEDNGIADRKAVGGEVRYYDPHRSFFSLVDYDTSYDSMNIFLFVGNWLFPDNTNVNLSLDYRKSPLLTTSNALQGQSVETLDDLLDTYSEEEIRQLAEDRTATSKTFTLGASHPLNSKLQVSGDMTLSRLSGTKASGGVEAFEGTGTEGFYSAQLTASSLIKEGDIAVVGLRYADASTSNTVSLNLNTRYPVNRTWRINPRFRVDYRENTDTIGRQLKYRPSIRMDYYWKRRIRIEVEAGGEWSDDKISGFDENEKTRGYFWNIGYRADF